MARRLLMLALVVPALALSQLAVWMPAPTATAAPLTGLPTHFGIGLTASPDDLDPPTGWVPQSGIHFDYAYQYLAGGLQSSWTLWNDNAMFPINYANQAKAQGAIPVFPYYMLFQTPAACAAPCPEAKKDLATLNNAAVMRSFYADFRVLMQRLGPGTYAGVKGYGGTTIVHVEPDLSGYAQQAVRSPAAHCYSFCVNNVASNDPNRLRAKVKGTGVRDVAAYPDTWRGFNLALLHLRDRYAPNVKLAFHISNWTTLRDISSDTDPSLDPVALGKIAGEFASNSGVRVSQQGTSTYDLVFNDVADRDAGHYKYGSDVTNRDAWWDKLNVEVPNFTRYNKYLRAIYLTVARRIVIWQIPIGNQHYTSMDNTDGHFQDNRIEYFFDHIAALKNSGVIATLYGRGNSPSTAYTDDQNDGVTNPAPVCTTDGTSSTTPICPSTVPTRADDDGGYLYLRASAYDDHPVPL